MMSTQAIQRTPLLPRRPCSRITRLQIACFGERAVEPEKVISSSDSDEENMKNQTQNQMNQKSRPSKANKNDLKKGLLKSTFLRLKTSS